MSTKKSDPRAPVLNDLQRAHPLNLHRALMTGMVPELPEDPLVAFFSDDANVIELEPDGGAIAMAHWTCCAKATLAFPCMLIQHVLLCSPCGLCILQGKIVEAGKRNRLVLREKTLLYQMDAGDLTVFTPGQPLIPMFSAGTSVMTKRIEFAIPLDDNVEFELIPAASRILGGDVGYHGFYPIETLIVRAQGQLICSIDAPRDARAFILRAEQQIAFAMSTTHPSKLIPDEKLQGHRAAVDFICSFVPIYGMRSQTSVPQSRSDHNNPSSAPLLAEMVRDNPTTSRIEGMSVHQVVQFIQFSGAGEFASLFEKQNIDGNTLCLMQESDLSELGVSSSLARKKILGKIDTSKQSQLAVM